MKNIIIILLLLLLNGCAQSTALLGPAYTLGTTGNAFQASVSYGTSYVIKKATGKTPSENIDKVLKKIEKNANIKEDIGENPDDFFKIVKKYIKKSDHIDPFIIR